MIRMTESKIECGVLVTLVVLLGAGIAIDRERAARPSLLAAEPLHKADRAVPPAATSISRKSPSAPKADNGVCYVCHLDLQKEVLTTVHLAQNVGCADCHGVSNDHMHDEMLMTKPDRLFGRLEVAPLCGKCHEDPHRGKAREYKAFLDQWRGRDRPNGRVVGERSICTDCHGTHNIAKNRGANDKAERPSDWTPLFDGRSLAGWKPWGGAAWAVRQGRLVGTPPTDSAGADLRTEAQYENYRLSATFQVVEPLRAAILIRADDDKRGSRVEIVDVKAPSALTGSVFLSGDRLALANLKEDLFEREGWNTLSLEVREERVQVWLNGEEIGATRIAGPAKGRIGLHLEGGAAFRQGQLAVREILVHKLPEEPAK